MQALDSKLERQLQRLASAVNTGLYVGNNHSEAELLEAAGLVKYEEDCGSMFSSDYVYVATPAGKELYEKLKEAKHDGS